MSAKKIMMDHSEVSSEQVSNTANSQYHANFGQTHYVGFAQQLKAIREFHRSQPIAQLFSFFEVI